MTKITKRRSETLKRYRENLKENRPEVYEARKQKSNEASKISSARIAKVMKLERNPELNPNLTLDNGKLIPSLSDIAQKHLYASAYNFKTLSRTESGGMLNYVQIEINRLKEIEDIAEEMERVSAINLFNLIKLWNDTKNVKYITKGKIKFGYIKKEELDIDSDTKDMKEEELDIDSDTEDKELLALVSGEPVSVTVFLRNKSEKKAAPAKKKAAQANADMNDEDIEVLFSGNRRSRVDDENVESRKRKAVVEEISGQMDLLKKFEGIVPADELNERTRKLYSLIPELKVAPAKKKGVPKKSSEEPSFIPSSLPSFTSEKPSTGPSEFPSFISESPSFIPSSLPSFTSSGPSESPSFSSESPKDSSEEQVKMPSLPRIENIAAV